MEPLISIIIPAKDAVSLIKDCLNSIQNQTIDLNKIEVCVVVPDFEDPTAKYSESIKEKLNLTVIPQDGIGIYGAMNTGIRQSKGDYIIFLGADDLLAHADTLAQIEVELVQHRPDVLHGIVDYVPMIRYIPVPIPLNGRFFFSANICHQGMLYKREILLKFPFDEQFMILADWNLNVKLFFLGINFHSSQIRIAKFCTLGISNSPKHVKIFNLERTKLRKKHYNIGLRLIYFALKVPGKLKEQLTMKDTLPL